MLPLVLLLVGADPAPPPAFQVESKVGTSFVVVNKIAKPKSACTCVPAPGGVRTCGEYTCPANGGKGICDCCKAPEYKENEFAPPGWKKVRNSTGPGTWVPWHLERDLSYAAPGVALPSGATFPPASSAGGCGCEASRNCGASFCKSRGGTGCPTSCPVKK